MFKLLWTVWLTVTALGASWLYMALPGDKPATSSSAIFLPDSTSHGHYQIELKCAVCHQPDGKVTDQSCIDCHAADLKQSRDTHAKSKFNDPTKAGLLEILDARSCLSCHVEHQEDSTHEMGVTLPDDYCFHCHQDVAEDRPSHKGLAFNTCANAGCHNYHDNTALYENYLHKHSSDQAFLTDARNPSRRIQQWLAKTPAPAVNRLTAKDADAPPQFNTQEAVADWVTSGHAMAGVNCSGCHIAADQNHQDAAADNWIAKPDHQTCKRCHDKEVDGFMQGHHGMRLSVDLNPLTVDQAHLPMHASAGHKQLDCNACHSAHDPNLQMAAFDACISCHDDQHSRSYAASSHHELWNKEVTGTAPAGSGVSCATCHMPRDEEGYVQHNQNDNLRPNEKMARTVCMNCHGLPFTLNALAEPQLKTNCYSTSPTVTIKSFDMVNDWFESKKK